MADPAKDLEIRLKATGGDAAAAEVDKAESSLEAMAAELARVKTAMAAVRTETPAADKAMRDFAGSLTDAELRVNGAREALGRMDRGLDGAGRSSRNTGLAVLEFSRAVEDAQYGIRGMLNNIPGLIMMLGGSGGLAGVVSLVAVAAATLGPLLMDLVGSMGTISKMAAPEMIKATKDWATETDAASAAFDGLIDRLEKMSAGRQRYVDSINARVEAGRQLADLLEEETQAEEDLAVARGDKSESDVKAARAGRASDRRNQQAAADRERMVAEIALARETAERERQAFAAMTMPNSSLGEAVSAAERARRPASEIPDLRPLVDARNEAVRAAANTFFNSDEEEAAEEAQKRLAEAQDKMIREADEALAARIAEKEALRKRAENAAEIVRKQEEELKTFDTIGAMGRDSQKRTDFLRVQAEEERSRSAANANQTAVPASLIGELQGAVAMADQGNQPLIGVLKGMLSKLQNGTDAQELATLAGQVEQALALLEQSDAGGKARLDAVQARLTTLEKQVANGRSFD